MQSSRDTELRRREAEHAMQKYGIYIEYPNVTEAHARIAHSDQIANTQVPSGQPLLVQDSGGVLAWLKGIDEPVNPNA